MTLAPIILFVYNRPWHTEQTLRALMANDLASESELFIYADGPKETATEEQLQKIQEVRQLIRKDQWCGKVHIIESDKNKGLANSVIKGVSDVVNKYGKVIVLEDDLKTSPTFLTYMNKSLEYYESYNSVYSISADIPMKMPLIEDYDYDVFVSYRNFSYGWGTWKNRWNNVDWRMHTYSMIDTDKHIQSAFNRGGDDLYNMLQAQKDGLIDSWAVRFTLAHFINHAVSIMPTQTFVNHIGFDGSGIHCSGGINDMRPLNSKREYAFLPIIYEDSRWINAFYSTYYRGLLPLWKRIVNKLYRKFVGQNVFVKQGKVFVK